jgi:hypothetical protein
MVDIKRVFNFVKLKPFDIEENYIRSMEDLLNSLNSFDTKNYGNNIEEIGIFTEINTIESEPETASYNQEDLLTGQVEGKYFRSNKAIEV